MVVFSLYLNIFRIKLCLNILFFKHFWSNSKFNFIFGWLNFFICFLLLLWIWLLLLLLLCFYWILSTNIQILWRFCFEKWMMWIQLIRRLISYFKWIKLILILWLFNFFIITTCWWQISTWNLCFLWILFSRNTYSNCWMIPIHFLF